MIEKVKRAFQIVDISIKVSILTALSGLVLVAMAYSIHTWYEIFRDIVRQFPGGTS